MPKPVEDGRRHVVCYHQAPLIHGSAALFSAPGQVAGLLSVVSPRRDYVGPKPPSELEVRLEFLDNWV